MELAKRIRNKELKSEDLVRACVERIKAVSFVFKMLLCRLMEKIFDCPFAGCILNLMNGEPLNAHRFKKMHLILINHT